jgi:predicted transcriptional regulator
MPAIRIDMRKLKDALRLKFEGGQSHQQIATALGISKGVVTKYAGLAVAAGLDWPAIAAMDEATLERRLLASPRPSDLYAQPDYGRIHQELARASRSCCCGRNTAPKWATSTVQTTP